MKTSKYLAFLMVSIAIQSCSDNPIEGCIDANALNYNSNVQVACKKCCEYAIIKQDTNSIDSLIEPSNSVVVLVNDTIDYSTFFNGTGIPSNEETQSYDINNDGAIDIAFKSSNSPYVRYLIYPKGYISLTRVNTFARIKIYDYAQEIKFIDELYISYAGSNTPRFATILEPNSDLVPNLQDFQSYYIGIFLEDSSGNITHGWAKFKSLDTDYKIVFESYGYKPIKNQSILAGK